ncbi:S1 family peptidase [Streptomyces sp. NPDC001288]|uniref:S1 family peptidase n=1 Tax=unclassified Streptomyces TaxID=2593676 RepID=UPI00331FC8C6
MVTRHTGAVRRIALAAALIAAPLTLGAAPAAHAVTGAAASDTTYGYTARLDIGDGTRACSGTLVDSEWLLTAASCFADDPAASLSVPAGKPKLTTSVTVGRTDLTTTDGAVRTVVELVPRTDRDLVLARLNRPVTDVTPVAPATTQATAGESLTFAGYGRTRDEWAPLKLHTGTLSVDSSDSTTATVTGQGAAVCAGDAGGPEVRVTGGKATLVAVNSRSWQGGCFGTDTAETRTGGIATRVDGLGDWIASKVNATRITDFDCDGVEDVAVGDPTASVNGMSEAGIVKIVYGGGRTSVALHQDLDYVPGGAEAGDRFGEQLAVVDWDEDGCSDLVVGIPHEDIGTVADGGEVNVIYGSPDGLGQGRAATNYSQGNGTGAIDDNVSVADDEMGAALAAGTTAAGEPYLAIGVPGKNLKGHVDAGLVFYLRGSINTSIHQDDTGVVGVIEDNDRFGAALAGSPNNLAVGASGETSDSGAANAGSVTVFKHVLSAAGIPTPVATVDQDSTGISDAAEPGDQFGASLSMIAYRPDGAASATDSILAVGTPGETLWVGTTSYANAGQVTTLRVTAAGTVSELATISQGTAGVNGGSATDDGFGTSVAAVNTAPRAVGTASTLLLAVGVPGKDVDTATDAGVVQTFSLLGAPGDSDHWIQAGNERGLPGIPGASQRVGAFLNATGTHLWIGMPYGPAARGAVHGIPWSNAMGGTGATVITYQPGAGALPLTGKAFGMGIR